MSLVRTSEYVADEYEFDHDEGTPPVAPIMDAGESPVPSVSFGDAVLNGELDNIEGKTPNEIASKYLSAQGAGLKETTAALAGLLHNGHASVQLRAAQSILDVHGVTKKSDGVAPQIAVIINNGDSDQLANVLYGRRKEVSHVEMSMRGNVATTESK